MLFLIQEAVCRIIWSQILPQRENPKSTQRYLDLKQKPCKTSLKKALEYKNNIKIIIPESYPKSYFLIREISHHLALDLMLQHPK